MQNPTLPDDSVIIHELAAALTASHQSLRAWRERAIEAEAKQDQIADEATAAKRDLQDARQTTWHLETALEKQGRELHEARELLTKREREMASLRDQVEELKASLDAATAIIKSNVR
jgi:chromosome segregation ATPase